MTMKKLTCLLLIPALYLSLPTPARSDFYYVIRLRNGGSLATPMYWSEGSQVNFFYAGGTVGIAKQTVERLEKHQGTRNSPGSPASEAKDTKELPPPTATTEKSPGAAKRPEEIERKPPGEDKKDPSILKEFADLENKFASRNNMSSDGLNELKYNLAELRGKIVSSPSEAAFRAEANKITEMRRSINDLLNIKSGSQ